MYSVSLQRYNYNRTKGIALSFVVNFFLLFITLSSFGSLFGNITNPKNQRHSISIKGYNIVQQQNIPQDTKVTQHNPIKNEEIIEKKSSRKKKTDVKSKKNIKIVDKKTNNSTGKKDTKTETSNSIQKHDNQNNSENILTEPTHFGIKNPPPEYPVISFQRNESGSVTIEYTVSPNGDISDAKVIESSGFPRLDKMSLITFKKWKFKPAISVTGIPVVSSPQKITFIFDINTHTIKEE